MSRMAHRFRIVAIIVFVVSSAFAQPLRTLDASVERKIDSLLSLMTLEEKLGQLNQSGGVWNEKTHERIDENIAGMLRKGEIGSFLGVIDAKETRRVQQIAVEESRLHIPVLLGLDVIHGYRTTFPIPLAQASSWNPSLVEQAARVAATEATSSGVHWTFAPMVDIARDPRWGRIAEGAGEDPFLGSAMAVAQVRGFQGTNLKDENSLLACAKHFAAYGGAEAGRDYNTVDVSERTLREIYLPPFKAAVDAGVGTLMTAFNEIAGVPSSSNRWLLTDLLRGEWAFNGFVVSDFESINELRKHRVADSRMDAGVLALNAGLDMDMVDYIYLKELGEAVKTKKLPEDVLNTSARRVLRVKFALGLFDDPYRGADTTREKRTLLAPEHLELARKVAQQSMVLLKNEKNLLPLKKTAKTIALIGPLADNKSDLRGPWSAEGRPKDVVTVLEGLKTKLPRARILYSKGCEISSDSGVRIAEAIRLVKEADAAILVLGESETMSGEANSRSNIDLPGRQLELLKAVHKTGKPVVLVLMNGRPLTIPWEAANIPAILEAWFPGIQGGNAVADVLFGDANPSGKLPVAFPRSVGQIPIYYNAKSTGRPMKEDDKYTSKYLDVPNTPQFPFGFGLSYTTFAYSNVRLSSATVSSNQELKVLVDVTNNGSRSGGEVVQLYVQDEVAAVTRPVKELKGFEKVSLNAGEKKTIEFVLKPEHLAFYDLQMKKVVEPGMFKVFVGGNSVDVLETRFEVK